jgi:hypothetical protein
MFQLCCFLEKQSVQSFEQSSIARFFTLDIFPYKAAYEMWSNVPSTNSQGQNA